MKSLKPILLSFGAVLLAACCAALLPSFLAAYLPRLLTVAWGALVSCLVLGGLAWLFFQVVIETLGKFKSPRKKILASAILLASLALTAALSFMYLWVLIASLLLAGCLLWRLTEDYRELFRKRKTPAAPQDWHALGQGRLPTTTASRRAAAKARFGHSYEVHIAYVPRVGARALSSQPLRMEE